MDLDEQIGSEQERNDRLRREIADLMAEEDRLAISNSSADNAMAFIIAEGPVSERIRQKMESDERLAALKLKKQESLRSDVNLTQTKSVSASVPSKKADYVRGRRAQSIASDAHWGSQPDVLKRRAIVKQNPASNAKGICELFDGANVPLTKRMKEAGSWSKAYKAAAYRHAVEALISRDRKIVSA